MKTIEQLKTEAKYKAIDSLARYKFMMFGYWAAIWVDLNKVSIVKEANPFTTLVKEANRLKGEIR